MVIRRGRQGTDQEIAARLLPLAALESLEFF